MSDSSFSVRIDAEDKDKLLEYIQETGKTNKEFMSTLISLYEINKSKAQNINLVGDIEELEAYTLKINKVFLNMIDKLEGQKASIVDEKGRELSIYKEKVNTYADTIKTVQEENTGLKEYIKNVEEIRKQNEKQIQQLEESSQDKTRLVEEYKSKNNLLLKEMTRYETAYDRLEKCKSLLEDSEKKNIELNNSIKALEEDNLKLKETLKDIKKLSKENENIISSLKENFIKELENERFNIRLQKDKEILELKQSYQEKINKIYEDHQEKINKYQDKIESYIQEKNNIIKSLRDEEKKKRKEHWDFALGLQKIDGFEPDEEYLKLIEKEINGQITLDEMEEIILSN